jgi:hypothetical protein
MKDKIENHFSGKTVSSSSSFFAEELSFQIPHGALQQKN